MKRYLLTLLTILLSLNAVFSKNATPLVYKINLRDDVNSSTWLFMQKGITEAHALSADQILIHMNTYGGEVVYADSIRTKILNSKIPVSVFIDNNAASAGALISIACQNIYMQKGANIGAATVVNETGEQAPDKYQSYMRATMRTTAEAHGKDTIVENGKTIVKWKRDPQIAEAMVDERIVIPNVIDSGRTLTFTTLEAIKYGFCEGEATSVDEIITKKMGYEIYELKEFKPSAFDKIKGFLTGTFLRGILIMIIIAGIYFELQTPGIGFPLIAAITAAVLYFAPLYIDGLAANWEIIIFVAGLVLLALEVFVIPGFGIAGISGIALIVAGLVLATLDNIYFDFRPVPSEAISEALLTVVGAFLFGGVGVALVSSRIGHKGFLQNVALIATQDIAEGYIGVPVEQTQLIGQTGIASTDLRPSGKVRVHGEIYDAVSEEGFIEKSSAIRISRYEHGQVYVVTVES